MRESTDDIRYDMTITRAELDGTIGEIKSTIRSRADDVRQTVRETTDIAQHTRDNPWIAIGLAVAAGVAVGVSGAERKAAEAVVAGGSSAASALADGVAGAKDAVVAKLHRSESGEPQTPQEPEKPGIRERLAADVQSLLYQGLDDVLRSLGRTHPGRGQAP
jgi:ElaB/YqjD/DUF883 family membrane-anchored ribosome-binding protein